MHRSRSTGAIGTTFKVVAVESRLKDYDAWDLDDSSSDPLNVSIDSSTGSSPFKSGGNNSKAIGSKNILIIKRGDIINVLAACNPDGSQRRAVPRTTKRLTTGFLDANAPIHDPYNTEEWWIGTLVKRNKKDARLKTGRFPTRCVALMAELRVQNATFRCKMCSRMMQNFVTNKLLDDFGITGQPTHLFGEKDLCSGCGPKILRVIKSVAQCVLTQGGANTEGIVSALKTIARKKLIHETAVEAYALTPERVPKAPPARRSDNWSTTNDGSGSGSPSPRAAKVTFRQRTPPHTTNNNEEDALATAVPLPPLSAAAAPPKSIAPPVNDTPETKETTPSPAPVNAAEGCLGNAQSLLPGLSVIFQNACAREGHLTKEHLVRMVDRLSKDHQEAKDFECNLETAEVIIDALDADGNGTVEFTEWSEWIVRGAERTSKERDSFKNQNTILYSTMIFLETIAQIAKKITLQPQIESLRPFLISIFEDAMQSKTEGHLDSNDIMAMIEQLQVTHPTITFVPCDATTAETIVQSLDADDNGTVEMDEFVPWIMHGMSKTKEQRDTFAQQGGATFGMLIQLMESLTEVATAMLTKVNNLRPGLKILFDKYATVDEEGGNEGVGISMSPSNLQTMVQDLSSRYIVYDNAFDLSTGTKMRFLDCW